MAGPEPGTGSPDFVIQIDGSAKFNPGPAGIGVRIADRTGAVVGEISRAIGVRTNNQAEYEALLCGLQEAAKLPPGTTASVETDSQLLYYQMAGRYRVKNPALKPLHAEALRLLRARPGVTIRLVTREQNRATDKLARMASGVLARKAGDGAT